MPVKSNLYLSDSLKCKSWKKEDEGMEAQPSTSPGCQRFEGKPGMLWAVKCFCFASSGLCSQVLIGAVISREGEWEVCVLNTSVGLLQEKGPSR